MTDYNKMEKKEAKVDGAKLVKNSGRGEYAKGDAALGNYLIDYKFHGASKSFTINSTKLRKHKADANREGKIPVFCIKFSEREKLAIVEWETFQSLIEDGI